MTKAKPTLRKKLQYQQPPSWDWTKGVTQSSLESFMACREQFALGYLEGWASKSFSVPLEFGSIIHFCLEKLATGVTLNGNYLSRYPIHIVKEVTKSYYDSRKKTLNHTDTNALEVTLANAEAIFPLYVAYWAEYDAKITYLQREKVFRVPHRFDRIEPAKQDDKNGFCYSSEIVLTGMRDGDYRNSVGELALFETKTKSSIDDVAIQDGLRADLQTCLYLLSLQKEYKEDPKEILYNIIRRPQLRQKKNEHIEAFKERVSADVKERPEWYFRRFEVTVVPGDLELFVKTTLDPVLRQLLQWWESIKDDPFARWASPYHYRSLPALMTKYGKAWHYNLTVRGLKNEYYRKSSPFPELEGHS